jgi:hypothetical protein
MIDSVLILLLSYGHHDWFNKVFLFLFLFLAIFKIRFSLSYTFCHDSTRDNDDDIIHWGKADEPP